MVSPEGKLVLIDHETEVTESPEKFKQAVQRLIALKEGDDIYARIAVNFRGALQYNRKTMGGVELSEEEVEKFTKNITDGAKMALENLGSIFSDSKVANQFFRMDPTHGSEAFKKIEDVLSYSIKK